MTDRTRVTSTSGDVSYEILDSLIKGAAQADVACPICGSLHQGASAARKVMRLYRLDNGGISFKCQRCEQSGWTRGTSADRPYNTVHHDRLRLSREKERREARRRQQVAELMWHDGLPVTGTIGEIYYRKYRGITCPLADQYIHFMPAWVEFPAAIVLPFIRDQIVVGVHLTRLNPDGSKIDKITLGKGTVGLPLVMADAVNENDLDLLIAEGPEDALSLHQSLGSTAWAASSKDRLPALAAAIPQWVSTVWIKPDFDRDGGGLRRAAELVTAIRKRGFTAHLLGARP